MANQKISALNSATTTDGTEVLPVVQSAETKKMATSVIKDWILGLPNLFTRAQTIQPSQAETALTVRRATSGQTEDILMVQAQDNTVLARFDKDGKITAPTLIGSSGTLTASAPVLDVTQTWNAAGVTFTGLKANFTDTASATGSLLMDLQVGGSSKFSVNKVGLINAVVARLASFNFGTAGATNWFALAPAGAMGWFTTDAGSGVWDISLYRDAANTLAQRNGVNAQTFRWYQSFTAASNYTRGALSAASGIVKLAAESAGTGAADIDVQIDAKGTGRLRYGTHAAIGAETITGYIEIKDAGGTVRKIAVVS